MKNQTKWLIGVVVVVVFSAGAYLGTNTDLFKGSIRGGEKGGLPVVPKARCEMFKKYQDEKGYSNLIGILLKGKSEYVEAFKEKYPSLWFGYANNSTCGIYKNGWTQARLLLTAVIWQKR